MATGYTYPVEEGKITTLAEFVWNCARAFFYDDSMPQSLEKKADAYHRDMLVHAQRELKEAKEMSLSTAGRRAQAAYQEELARLRDGFRQAVLKRSRYDAMLTEVRCWEPPTPEHQDLKKFMFLQLESSKDYIDLVHHEKRLAELEKKGPVGAEEYRQAAIAGALEQICYHEEGWAKNQKLAASTTAWLQKLNQSVPRPKK